MIPPQAGHRSPRQAPGITGLTSDLTDRRRRSCHPAGNLTTLSWSASDRSDRRHSRACAVGRWAVQANRMNGFALVLLRAAVVAFLIELVGEGLWGVFLALNLSTTPALPWAIL